jgi:hypothetical protein
MTWKLRIKGLKRK